MVKLPNKLGKYKYRKDSDMYFVDPISNCWIGKYALHSQYKYPRMVRNGRYIYMYRYFYEKYVNEVPKDKCLDHLCRNRLCVNPKHLEVTTIAENCRRGKVAKLKPEQVKLIRLKYKNKEHNQRQLANLFGVGADQISRIVNHKRWANVALIP